MPGEHLGLLERAPGPDLLIGRTVMRSVGSRTVRPVFLLAGVAAAMGQPGCTAETIPEAKIEPAEPPLRLVVVTPHNQRIQAKFEQGFAEWHQAQFKKAVDIQWVTRGTPQCLTYIQEAAEGAVAPRRLAPDLMFGGGITDHQWLVDHGLAKPVVGTPLPEEASVPPTLLGVPLRDRQGYWQATALTSFGMLCNRQACAERGVPEPKTWADLAEPAYRGWVALADPARSGSNRFCLNLILQRHGWDKGWGLVLRMAANARALLPSSSEVIASVSSGLCLAGPSVNFNALHEAARVGGERLAFVAPADATAITPDVMTVLNFASSPELAERLVRYCLSEEGQVLWSVRDTPVDETKGIAGWQSPGDILYRYPVVPAIYDQYADRLSVAGNPFKRQSDFRVDMALEQKQARIIAPLLLAACGENHVLLQRAWQAVIDAGLPAEALAELTRPPFDESTAYELGTRHEQGGAQADQLAKEWSAAFRTRYRKVLDRLGR